MTIGDGDGSSAPKRIKRLKRQFMRKNLLRSRRSSHDNTSKITTKTVKSAGTTTSSFSPSITPKTTTKLINVDNNNISQNDNKYYSAENKKMIGVSNAYDLRSSLLFDVSGADTLVTETTALGLRPTKKMSDTSWERAVQKARGQPDGAEKSFGNVKLKSKVDSKAVNASANKSKIRNKLSLTKQVKTIAKNKLGKLQPRKPKQQRQNASMKRQMDETDFGPPTPKKKQRFSKLGTKERKNVRKILTKNEEHIKEAKKLFNELQRHDLEKNRREEICKEFMTMVKGHVAQYVFCHDTGRTIQCLLKYGNPEQRQKIFDELKDIIVKMATTKYSRHLVRKLLKYGTKQQRAFILKKFHGVIRKLIRNREAAEVIEYAYNEFANASQRLAILEEFYGPSFNLFKSAETKTLDDFMTAQPDKREMVLRNMKEALLPLIDKSLLTYSLVHRVFNEYFTYADSRAQSEMTEVLRDTIVTMIHTREGAHVGMRCIWHGTAKDRKVIMKSFCGHVQRICTEEYSHMVLLAMFDNVDDTKMLKKCILDELFRSIDDIAQDTYGRKVLLYLLNPRDPLHFHPDVIKILQDGDGNIHSKKDSVLRHSELLDSVSEKFYEYIIKNSVSLATNNATLLLVLSILTHCHGDPTEAMQALAKMAAEPFHLGGTHIIESMAGHITFKRLISNDRDRVAAGHKVLFSHILLNVLPSGALKSWAACNRGCFTIISMLDLENSEITSRVIDLLAPIKDSLTKLNLKGAQILAQKCGF